MASAWAAESAVVSSEFIYETAPFPQCHASTLEFSGDTLVAAWFGGTREKDPDVGIWLARREDGKWTAPVEVANGVQSPEKRHPTWNPVLFQPKEGPLLLFYKVGPDPESWWGMLRTSTDHGRTWSDAVKLPDGFAGPIKNKPVQLADGAILCPSSSEDQGWRVFMETTRDLGKTWTTAGPLNDGKAIGAIQPSILFLPKGELLAIGRTQNQHLFEVRSPDGGKTWGDMKLNALPNPNSGTDAVTLQDGRHLLVYNHVAGDWGKRTPLNIAISTDGAVWQAAAVLEDKPGEYSYPAVVQAPDGQVHITYTWKRQRVRHAVVDPAKLSGKPIVDGKWPGKE